MDETTIIFMIGSSLWMYIAVKAFLRTYEKYKFCNDKTILRDEIFIPLAKGLVVFILVCLLVYGVMHYCPFFVKMREYAK